MQDGGRASLPPRCMTQIAALRAFRPGAAPAQQAVWHGTETVPTCVCQATTSEQSGCRATRRRGVQCEAPAWDTRVVDIAEGMVVSAAAFTADAAGPVCRSRGVVAAPSPGEGLAEARLEDRATSHRMRACAL